MANIREQVAYSQEGSDINGLVRKIAFEYHLRNSSESAEGNWLGAENTLIKWCAQHRTSHWNDNIEQSLHGLLNDYAHQAMKTRFFRGYEGSQFDDWMAAQDRLALQIIHQTV